MKKPILFLSFLFAAAFTFTDCSKKSSNPTPAAPTIAKNTLIISGTGGITEQFSFVNSIENGVSFVVQGAPNSSGTVPAGEYSLQVQFTTGTIPSGTFAIGGSVVTLVSLDDSNNNVWTASSGNVTVTNNSNGITATFFNLTFAANSNQTPVSIVASGSVTGD